MHPNDGRVVSNFIVQALKGEFTIRQLAEKVIELTGSASKLVFQPLPADDPMQRQPDIARAREMQRVSMELRRSK